MVARVDEQYAAPAGAGSDGPDAVAPRSAVLDRLLSLVPWALVVASGLITLGALARIYRALVPDTSFSVDGSSVSSLALDIGQALSPYSWADPTPWAALVLVVLAVLGRPQVIGVDVPPGLRRAATVIAALVSLLGLATLVTVVGWVAVTHGTVLIGSPSDDPSAAGLGDYQVDPWMTLFGAGVPALTATVLGAVAALALVHVPSTGGTGRAQVAAPLATSVVVARPVEPTPPATVDVPDLTLATPATLARSAETAGTAETAAGGEPAAGEMRHTGEGVDPTPFRRPGAEPAAGEPAPTDLFRRPGR